MTYLGGILDSGHAQLLTSGSALGLQARATGGTTTNAVTTAWPANNDAYVVPFQLAFPVTFTGMFWVSGTSPGTANIDLGVYSDTFVRLASLGATAAVNTTDIIQPAGAGAFASPLVLARGRYYMAMSAAATTITTRSQASFLNQSVRALGVFKMATAHPLPDPFVPASVGALVSIPVFGLVTATGVVI